jgi:hypothetical protein
MLPIPGRRSSDSVARGKEQASTTSVEDTRRTSPQRLRARVTFNCDRISSMRGIRASPAREPRFADSWQPTLRTQRPGRCGLLGRARGETSAPRFSLRCGRRVRRRTAQRRQCLRRLCSHGRDVSGLAAVNPRPLSAGRVAICHGLVSLQATFCPVVGVTSIRRSGTRHVGHRPGRRGVRRRRARRHREAPVLLRQDPSSCDSRATMAEFASFPAGQTIPVDA